MMRYDYIHRYWDKFGNNGFKRLINEGTFCKNTNLDYIFTQTGPGHATISTGAVPASHGIVSNEWYRRLKGKKEYCVDDGKAKTIGSEIKTIGRYSPKNLYTSTIGDQLKLSNLNKSKVYSVSMKNRAAILSGGHKADGAFWFDPNSGNWITSSYYMDSLPSWAFDFRKKKLQDLYLSRIWNTLYPIEEYTESVADSTAYEKGIGDYQFTFPYNLEEMSMVNGKRSYNLLKYVPAGNTYTKDFALAIIINEELGKDDATDIMFISFSGTDYAGHKFGTMAVEMEDIYLRLDKEIAHLLTFIDDNFGKENVLLYLTADHGVMHSPEYLKEQKIPSGRFKDYYFLALLKSYLNAVYGEGKWISFLY